MRDVSSNAAAHTLSIDYLSKYLSEDIQTLAWLKDFGFGVLLLSLRSKCSRLECLLTLAEKIVLPLSPQYLHHEVISFTFHYKSGSGIGSGREAGSNFSSAAGKGLPVHCYLPHPARLG